MTNERSKLKIGVFHPPFRSEHFGGSVAVTVPIVNALVENGYGAILLVSYNINQKKLREMMGEEISPRVEIVFKPSLFQPRSLVDLYESAFELLALKLRCDLVIDTYSNYVFPWTDVCYIHFPYFGSFKERFPYLRRKKNSLFDVVGLPYVFLEKNLDHFEKKLFLANSHFTADAITSHLKTTAKVLYPPVSTKFFQNDSDTWESHQRENLVVTVGRITEDKNIIAIPQIANLLREEDIQFIIIGFAHSESALMRIRLEIQRLNLNEKIIVLTDVSRAEMKNILRRAKVYLHPPTIEHFGISIAEAMALGCLPVIYDIGGAREFVPSECRYRNLLGAAEKVKEAINQWSPEKARKMKALVERFAEPNFRENFIKIFSEYIEQHPKNPIRLN